MEILILVLSLLDTAALAALLWLSGRHRGKHDSNQAQGETRLGPAEDAHGAYLAEKRFSEGVLNVLNYDGPAERSGGI